MLTLLVAGVFSFMSLIGGIAVLYRGVDKAANKVFFSVAITSAIWSVVFASIEQPNNLDYVIVLNKFAYAMGLLVVLASTLFSFIFPRRRNLKPYYLYAIVTVPMIVLSFSEILAGKVTRADGQSYLFEYGTLSIVYALVMITGVVMIIINGFKFGSRVSEIEKKQAIYVVFGFIMSLVIGVFLAVILPIIDPLTKLDDLAPASLSFMIVFVSLAIVKHKLFDFRAAIARTIAYASVLLIVVLLYITLAFLLKNLLFPELQVTPQQLVSNIVLALLLVATVPQLRIYFNRTTNKIFFRDVYDPQTLIDDLNQTIVSNVDLEILLTRVAQIVNQYIKTSYCMFYIRPTAYVEARIIGEGRTDVDTSEITKLHEITTIAKRKVIDVDEYAQDKAEQKLVALLKKNEIDLLARLVNNVELDVKGIGLMFLGAKRSGSPFNKQDIRILEIIANELVIAVENVLRYEEIDKFNVTLQQKIDDATRELRRTNEKLVALDEAKDEFVSMASHQLRTPLTSIKGYVSMVADEDMGKLNTQQKKMLGQAMFSSQRMVYLIADLLNVSRLRTGKFVIESKPVHLPTIIESELSQLREGASAKDITFTYRDPKEFPILYLDEMKIRQVIMNFTDNAIYYTPNGGKITLELKESQQSVEFTVKDNGIGVPKDERHKLFTKFYRANNAKKARPDGTGLGLFMAKKVIIAQGGSVVFDSIEGKGSTFGFNFPKNAVKVPEGVVVNKKKVMTSVGSEAMPEPSLED